MKNLEKALLYGFLTSILTGISYSVISEYTHEKEILDGISYGISAGIFSGISYYLGKKDGEKNKDCQTKS